ncbi:MAG TPA: DUF3761 domain-containing protein [Gemmatimonadaceae bacterium]
MRGRILTTAVALLTIGLYGAQLQAQAAASVCKDGTTSTASGKGACSGHGGVDAKATAAAKKAEKKTEAAKSAPAEVMCTDGTMSKPGRGACSKHGGVKGSVPAATAAPSLPAAVPATAPARARSEAKSAAPTAGAAPKTAAKPSTKRGEDNDPTDAIAQCKDGMYSHAANRRGACSKHGGVAKFLKP